MCSTIASPAPVPPGAPQVAYCAFRLRRRGYGGRVGVIRPTADLPDASSPLRKNISVFQKLKSSYMICHPVPKRGALAIVTNVGTGSGGRGGARAHPRSQGGFYRSVSGHDARRRTALQRTAKACGPDASAVGVKSRGGFESPTGWTKP